MTTDAPPPIPKTGRVALSRARAATNWEIVFRVLTVLVIIAALGLALWSLFGVWFPVQKEAQARTSTLARLSDEVDQLDRKWPKAEAEQVQAAYQSVRSNLFSDETGLDDWLGRLRAESTSLNLGIKVDFGKPATPLAAEQNLTVVHAKVSVDFKPAAAAGESPYQRLLRLIQELPAEAKRADLTEITVEGGSASVNRAVLVFTLWASAGKER